MVGTMKALELHQGAAGRSGRRRVRAALSRARDRARLSARPRFFARCDRLWALRSTAARTGGGSVACVSDWIDGQAPLDGGVEQRLRNAYDVTQTLLEVESTEIVQAWLLGMNPQLDDRAPASVLAEDPAAVMRAARFFVANG